MSIETVESVNFEYSGTIDEDIKAWTIVPSAKDFLLAMLESIPPPPPDNTIQIYFGPVPLPRRKLLIFYPEFCRNYVHQMIKIFYLHADQETQTMGIQEVEDFISLHLLPLVPRDIFEMLDVNNDQQIGLIDFLPIFRLAEGNSNLSNLRIYKLRHKCDGQRCKLLLNTAGNEELAQATNN